MGDFSNLDIWVGNFDSESRLDEFLEESYDDDDEPISAFARCQGEGYYDHDYLEADYERNGFSSDTELVPSGFEFSGDGEQQVLAQLVKAQIKAVNTKLFVFGKQFASPRTCRGDGLELIYLGRFRSKPL